MATCQLTTLFVLVLCVADTALGLQYPLKYHYHYRARIAAGIPEINSKQTAASEIKADLYAYVTAPESVTFQLENVLVGEFHGQLDCEPDAFTPLQSYRTPSADEPGALIGRHPFGANQDELLFDAEDPQWLTNFYKSIVGLFSIAPLRHVHFAQQNYSEATHEGAYKSREGTVMGQCEVTNTQVRLSGIAANEHNKFVEHHIEEDVQLNPAALTTKTGRKTTSAGHKTRKSPSKRPAAQTAQAVSVPTLEPTLWQLIRSVNLEDCDHRVEHQHTLRGIYCNMAKDQCKNTMSRNSHGVFYLRGSENGMRIETAVVRGAVLVSPFGFETEMLSSQSVQKIALVSVKPLGSDRPSITSSRSDASIMFTMTLPYAGTGIVNTVSQWAKLGSLRESLEQFTALPITAQKQRENELYAVQLLKAGIAELSEMGNMYGSSNASLYFNYVTMILYDFNDQQMESFVSQATANLPANAFDLLSGVVAEVGSESSAKVMAHWMAEGKLTARRQVLFFATMRKNAKSARTLKILLNYLKTENLNVTPFKTSQSYINFASLIYKLCLRSDTNYGSFALFAKQICDNDNIVAEFEKLVIDQLQTADKFWKQMVLVKALVGLRSEKGAAALVPYVVGNKKCDNMVRLTAMGSLTSWNAHSYDYEEKEKTTLLLLRLFENPAENRHIRARALSYLVSWPLSSTIWSRLAFSTQRPLLKDLSAFTYSLIKSVSEYTNPEIMQQALYASHALRLAKAATASRRYSSFIAFYKYCFQFKIGTIKSMRMVRDPLSPLPSEISLYAQKALGGTIIYKKFSMLLSNDYGDIDQIFLELFQGSVFNGDLGMRGDWDRFLVMLKGGLEIDERVRDAIRGALEYIPLSDMQLFIPLDHEFIVDIMGAIFGTVSPNYEYHEGSSYFNQMDYTFVTSNDLGMPVILSTGNPIALTYAGGFYVGNTANDKYEFVLEKINLGASSLIRNHLETMVLWSGKKVATGVSHKTTLQIPFDIHFVLQLPNKNLGLEPRFEASVKPSIHAGNQQISVAHLENMPYTLLRSTAVGAAEDAAMSLLPVLRPDSVVQDVKTTDLLPGIKISNARDAVPKSHSHGDPIMFFVAPDAHYMQKQLTIDVSLYKDGLFLLNATTFTLDRASDAGEYVTKYGKDSFEFDEGCVAQEQDIQQFTQTSDTYDYFTQQSSSQDIQEFQTFDSQQAQELSSFGSQTPERLVMDKPTDAEMARASYDVPDASSPMLQRYIRILRRDKGWVERIQGFSLRVDVNQKDKSTGYEALLAMTYCDKYKDQRKLKFVYVLGTSLNTCLTTCYDGTMTMPKLSDLDTLNTLSEKDLTRKIEMQVFSGAKCKDGPYESWNEVRSLRQETMDKLVSELRSDCPEDISSSGDPVDDFLNAAFYDSVVMTQNKYAVDNAVCSKSYFHDKIQDKFIDMFKVVIGPDSYDYCSWNSDDTTKIYSDIKRYQDSTFTGVTKYTSKKGSVLEKPFYFHTAPQWLEMAVNQVWHAGNEYESADYCVISKDSLVTFDGYKTNFAVNECPTLAVTNCEANSNDSFAVAVSLGRDGELTVALAMRYTKIVATIGSGSITVNNDKLEANEHFKVITVDKARGVKQEVAQVYRRNDFIKLSINSAFAIIMKEGKVYIKIYNPRYNGYLCGVCGNHDNEPYNDMKQPNGCLITDADQFRQTWIPSSSFTCYSSGTASKEFCLQEESQAQYPEYELTKIY